MSETDRVLGARGADELGGHRCEVGLRRGRHVACLWFPSASNIR